MDGLVVEPTDRKDFGPCPCCGNVGRRVWGFVHAPDGALAAYFVHWTVGRVADHWPNFDLIIGRWGEGSSAADRRLVALEYRLLDTGPSFRVINARGRPAVDRELVGTVLRRCDVIGRKIAPTAFAVVDAVLAQDERVSELLGPWRIVEPGKKRRRGGTKRRRGPGPPPRRGG